MNGAAKTPPLRFAGCKGEWEEKRLGDVATRFDYGLNAAAKSYDGKNKYIRITDIDNESHRYCVEGAVSPDCELDSANESIVNKGDVLFARTGASVGKAYLFREEDGLLYFAGFLIRIHVCEGAYPAFVFYTTLTEYYQQFVELTSQRSGQPGINAAEYRSFSFLTPSLPEQEKIGVFLGGLDALIAGREKALRKLEALKKAMLLKMFPQDGARVPEVRFKGFEGEWEEKTLGNIVVRVNRKNTGLESDLPLTISAEYGLISQYEYFNNRVASRDVSGYYLVVNGEFAYNKSTSDGSPWGVVKRLTRYPKGVLSTLYIVFAVQDNDVAPEYLERFFDTTIWHSDVSERAAEGARNHGLLNISPSDFFETRVLLPSLPEQQKIGAFFRSLDTAISGRRNEVEKLKQLKKGLLERMFA